MSVDMKITDWIQALSAVAIVLLTAVLAYLTRKYADANVRMARAIERDFTERNRPSPELDYRIEHRDNWLYSLEVTLFNRGLSPLRLDNVRVTHGQREMLRHENLILSPGEVRGLPSLRFSLHDLAADRLEEGRPITLDLVVSYRELDGSVQQIVKQPWVEYRERPRPRV